MKTNTNYRSVALGLLLAAGSALSTAQAINIKITIGYTTFAKDEAGGGASLRSIAQNNRAWANGAHDATNTNANLVLADFQEVMYNLAISSNSGAELAGILTDPRYLSLRNTAKKNNANLIYLVVGGRVDLNTGGLAYRPGRVSMGELTTFVLAHETGHSMNATHEQGVILSNETTTIMKVGIGRRIPKIQRFSKDGATFKGMSIGSPSQDNTGVIRARVPTTQTITF